MEVKSHKFLGLPAAKPRVWIDLSCTASKRAGLAMHTPGRDVLKWAVRILGWFAWLPIEKIARGPIKRFDELDGHEMIERAVDDLAAKKIEWMTLYMGNDSVKSKLTVMVKVLEEPRNTQNARNKYFRAFRGSYILKLGRTPEAAVAIRNEVATLKRLEATPLCAQVPVVVTDAAREDTRPPTMVATKRDPPDAGIGTFGEWTWSAQSVLPKGKSPVRMQKEHYAFLDELRRIGISHGDFAPWNCSIVGGKLYVWDWEDAGSWQEGKDESWFKSQVKKLLGVDA